jgi:uncharacterized protein (DUF1800 family)
MVSKPDPRAAFIAFNRFGFGARTGEFDKVAADPRGALRAELRKPDVALIPLDDPANADLVGTSVALQDSFAAENQRRLARLALAKAASPNMSMPPAGPAATAAAAMPVAMAAPPAAAKAEPPIEQRLFRSEARARFDKVAAADIGYVERLVHFWSNHFCVSVAKDNLVRATAGAFEREAIRPFVLGNFYDMLRAVEHHPAMLVYLDNQQSIGPDSRAGQNRKRGLNENLAREILELHTLGVGGGYTQSDVTTFARMLTGWMMAGREGRLGEPGTFVFNVNAHEPGEALFLGKTYPAGGIEQGEMALEEIARHPSTALHIATKLARHFIADDPPAAVVNRLAKVFQDREGDLRALANALIDTPEAWQAPMTKVRAPMDYLMAARRVAHPEPLADPGQTLGWLNALGEPLWQPPAPNGFADTVSAWASPEGMKVRLDIAWQMARQVKNIANPSDTLEAVIGPTASPETRQTIARAESKQQGLALLFMSPEFQRR